MRRPVTASTTIAGVVGHPVRHSLSPVIHNAWIEAAGLDAVYLAFAPSADGFTALVEGLRSGAALGLNVTLPFKQQALDMAGWAEDSARQAGAANLLLFGQDGAIEARNTDGNGLMAALAEAGHAPSAGPAVVLGAGGAARGAVLALLDAGVPAIAVVNRTVERAKAIADLDPRVTAHGWDALAAVLDGAAAVINATSLGMSGQPPLDARLDAAPAACVVMDMVYRPLETDLLRRARQRGHPTADGLAMLIGQALPSFEALFGQPAPADIDVRAICEAALAGRP